DLDVAAIDHPREPAAPTWDRAEALEDHVVEDRPHVRAGDRECLRTLLHRAFDDDDPRGRRRREQPAREPEPHRAPILPRMRCEDAPDDAFLSERSAHPTAHASRRHLWEPARRID